MCWCRICILIALAAAVPVLTAQAPPPPFLQADAVKLAAADVQTLPGTLQEYAQYLWVDPLWADADLEKLRRVLSGHTNGMSQEPERTPLAVVPGSGGRLLRLSLVDYGHLRATWDQYLKVQPDPFWSFVQDVHWEAGTDSKGAAYAAGTYPTAVVGFWVADDPLALTRLRDLVRATRAKAPIVSASFFVWTTFDQTNGAPSYNDFLPFKTEAEFFRLGGVRADEDPRFSQQLLSLLAESGITYEPRALERREKTGGALWRSHDFIKAVGAKNPIENYGADKGELRAKADAHEDYAHLPNDLFMTGLFNAAGAVQANAPDTITTGDHTSRDPRNQRVTNPRSCVTCHTQGGMQPLDDYVRNLVAPPPGLQLQVAVPDKTDPKRAVQQALELRRQYGRKLEPFLERDRQRYAAALLDVTGYTPEAYATAYGDVWWTVAGAKFDSALAARTLGVSETAFVAAIDREVNVLKRTGSVSLAGWLRPRAKQKPLQTRQFFEAYPQMQRTLRGIADLKTVKGYRP